MILKDHRRLCVTQSDGDGPTLVFLHGYLDSWRSFEQLFPSLDARYGLIALDQRGHGGSDEANDYAITGFEADAIETIQALASEPVHLIGHSLGAIVALRTAHEHPNLLSSITLIGGAVTAAGNAALSAFSRVIADVKDPIPYDVAYDFQKSTAFQPLPAAQLDGYVQESLKVSARAWNEALRGLIEDPYVVTQFSLKVPTLIIWGQHDEVFPLADQLELRRHLPNAKVINYPHYGHAPQWEAPAAVGSAIGAFIEGIENGSSLRTAR